MRPTAIEANARSRATSIHFDTAFEDAILAKAKQIIGKVSPNLTANDVKKTNLYVDKYGTVVSPYVTGDVQTAESHMAGRQFRTDVWSAPAYVSDLQRMANSIYKYELFEQYNADNPAADALRVNSGISTRDYNLYQAMLGNAANKQNAESLSPKAYYVLTSELEVCDNSVKKASG